MRVRERLAKEVTAKPSPHGGRKEHPNRGTARRTAPRSRQLGAFWKWNGGQSGKERAWQRGLGKLAVPAEPRREAGRARSLDLLLGAG